MTHIRTLLSWLPFFLVLTDLVPKTFQAKGIHRWKRDTFDLLTNRIAEVPAEHGRVKRQWGMSDPGDACSVLCSGVLYRGRGGWGGGGGGGGYVPGFGVGIGGQVGIGGGIGIGPIAIGGGIGIGGQIGAGIGSGYGPGGGWSWGSGWGK